MNKTYLIAPVIKTINDYSSHLWFPELRSELVKFGSDIIKDAGDLNLTEYGTNRIYFQDKTASRSIVTILQNPLINNSIFDSIQIEILDRKIISRYKEARVEFYEASEIIGIQIVDCIREAIEVIKLVPLLLDTIFALARSLHLIKLKDNDFDISFSEPHIPFSIFISVPNARVKNERLRVAEAVVHEVMHLQLTLIERIVPLVLDSNNKYYSPWKNEYRTTNGVLHALYVFRVLNSFFAELLDLNAFSVAERNYLEDRRRLIGQQIIHIQDFINSPDLTDLGRNFTERLIKL